jgi:hypothetical protein
MTTLILFMASYGLCFWLQNKATWFHEWSEVTDGMLECSFCTGFHCGWVTWLSGWVLMGSPWVGSWNATNPEPGAVVTAVLVWSFCVGAWCYLLDTLARAWESRGIDEGP